MYRPCAPLQDILDLRSRRWVPRQKAEGPKRIEDVHKEAQQQVAQQQARDREDRDRDRRGGGGGGGGGRGGGGGSRNDGRGDMRRDGPEVRAQQLQQQQQQDRMMSRDEVPTKTLSTNMQRSGSQEISLRPASFGTFGKVGARVLEA